MRSSAFAVITATLMITSPVQGQDLESAEVIVTGTRIEQDDYSRDMPAVGLRRTADFLVQKVTISGDTRDAAQRRQEIRGMLTQTVQLAAKRGLELAFGEYILTPLTTANLDDVTLKNGNRPDTQSISFLIKAPLTAGLGGAAAQRKIAEFIEAVPEVGRAQMDAEDEQTLSVVGPDKYRLAIADKVIADARELQAKMGPGYAVSIEGLNMPVQWSRASPSEVLLYVPYKLVLVPKP